MEILKYKTASDFNKSLQRKIQTLIGSIEGNIIRISKKPEDILFAQNKLNEEFQNKVVYYTESNTMFENGSIKLGLTENEENIEIATTEKWLPDGFCPHCGRH